MKSALFSEDWIGFGIACMYEGLMKETADRCARISRPREGRRLARCAGGDFETRRYTRASLLGIINHFKRRKGSAEDKRNAKPHDFLFGRGGEIGSRSPVAGLVLVRC